MDTEVINDSIPASGPASSSENGPDRETLRPRMERFARIRSAHRALPNAATEMEAVDSREGLAEAVRTSLKDLAGGSSSTEDSDRAPYASLEEIDRALQSMEADLLERIDGVGFAELRTTVPRAADLCRKEVTALVDSLLSDQEGLLPRLAKLEYLITVLSIEEKDGERKIVHDPATLTPALARLTAEIPETDETQAVAVELYQAACPDGDGETLSWHLRRSRDRKLSLGLTCLAPNVLRAVVTYNTRVFNLFASTLDSSRESDALLDQILGNNEDDRDNEDVQAHSSEQIDDGDAVWDRIGVEEDDAPPSVFESEGIKVVLEALRRRLNGIPIGSCTSERVALSLDASRLDRLEEEAIREKSPSPQQQVVSQTAVVGLLIRDIGVVRSQLAELGIAEGLLCNHWVRELDRTIGKLVSQKIGDPEQYAVASKLSGIKTKHLLAPMSALRPKSARKAQNPSAPGSDEAAAELRRLAQASAGPHHASSPLADSRLPASDSEGRWSLLAARRKQLATLSIPVVALLAVFGVNLVTSEPSKVDALSSRDLARHSPYLTSAYRSNQGVERRLVLGQVDRDFAALDPSRQVAVATELMGQLESEGTREAMLFGPNGKLRIHFVNGKLRIPAL